LSYELGTVSYIIIMERWNYWFSRRMTLIKLCGQMFVKWRGRSQDLRCQKGQVCLL